MQTSHSNSIASRLNIEKQNVAKTLDLLDKGASIPFIARYRKEVTGSLDEVQVSEIQKLQQSLTELDSRREYMLESLKKRELLTRELKQTLTAATTLNALEDIYLPHRQKRRTRGMMAREKGLEPLAKAHFDRTQKQVNPHSFISVEKDLTTLEEVLHGSRDIMAEWINEDAEVRAGLRLLYSNHGLICSKVIEKNREKGLKFSDYFDRQEHVKQIAGHRLLAMLRAEKEKIVTLSFRPQEDSCIALLKRKYIKQAGNPKEIELALEDSYKRLLAPSLENELRKHLKKIAETEAIKVFASNIKELLLAAPLGRKSVLALDPGFRTGAKLVCLDSQGKLLHTTTIYPTHGERKQHEAGEEILRLVQKFKIDAIAIGNGTASRETEAFVKGLSLPETLLITMVNEDGASIYSASESAREEFPEHDLTVRGSISIGRRLQDPLAELVKIDPKSIGVGQYQHDVEQTELKKSLEEVVISCVNGVGVEVNNASKELLSHVSGLGPVLAQNIIHYRNENGPFHSRRQLLKVPRLGPKAFEQCAGFLRVRHGKHPLDNSSVHPERYTLVEKMAKDTSSTIQDLIDSQEARDGINIHSYLSEKIGLPTLKDIMEELAKPGRDPRATFKEHSFAKGIHSIDDLAPDMELPGIVTNVTNFGAFVDIGVHQDGLVHISQLADRFVKDAAEIVKPRQQVKVRVLEIDTKRNRIALSMRKKR